MRFIFLITIFLFACEQNEPILVYKSKTSQTNLSDINLIIGDSINFDYRKQVEMADFDSISGNYLCYCYENREILIFDSLGYLKRKLIADSLVSGEYFKLCGLSFLDSASIIYTAAPNKIIKHSFLSNSFQFDSIADFNFVNSHLNALAMNTRSGMCVSSILDKKYLFNTKTLYIKNNFFIGYNFKTKNYTSFGNMEKNNLHLQQAKIGISLGIFDPKICFNKSNKCYYAVYPCDPHIYKYDSSFNFAKEINAPLENLKINGFKISLFNSASKKSSNVIQYVFTTNSSISSIFSNDNYTFLTYLGAIDSTELEQNSFLMNEKIKSGQLRIKNYLSVFLNEKKAYKDYLLESKYSYVALAPSPKRIYIKKFNIDKQDNVFYVTYIQP